VRTRTPGGYGPTPRALPFAGAFGLAASFGALGHFLPAERPALFAGVYRALRPGGVFAFPIGAPQPITSSWYWALLGFDLAMRVRNAVWSPPFVMYYRTCPLHAVRNDLTASGFTVTTVPLMALRPTRRRQPEVPACPRAHSQHALTDAQVAGRHLIAVFPLPRRTAGQNRPIMRPGTEPAPQLSTAIQMLGSSVIRPHR